LAHTRAAVHPTCVFCGPAAPTWLAISFVDDGEGGIRGSFACPPASEGYPGLVHGGIAAGLLDAAMTNALFARGVVALTGRLSVRYHRPLLLARPAVVIARTAEQRTAWWIVRAEIVQDGQAAASAEAWFRERSARCPESDA
jgi:acyl-coenzyme A thioesterase PaaI-like protein